MNIFIGMTRYALPVLAFIILVKCVMTLLLGHPVNKIYAYIIDSSTGEKIPLNMWETSIGKGKSCDIKLNYENISSSQAVISRRADGWYIFDTKSKGGTSVNGAKAEKRTLIKHGDKIKFADKAFVFAVADDPVITVGGRRRTKKEQESIPAPKNNIADKKPVNNSGLKTNNVSAAPPKSSVFVQPVSDMKASDFYNENFSLDFKGKEKKADELPYTTVNGDTLRTGQKIYNGNIGSKDIYSDVAFNRVAKAVEQGEPALINLSNGEIYVLCGSYIRLGRGSANDIRLNGSAVSRSHAALKKFKDGWAVLDADSKAGTFLNGKKIEKPLLLFENDIIQICDNKLKYTNDYKKRK
ncbi:MAG: FHA domain-containing protein [Clostridia bacterium]|nr:FHA domain-containing protein [Clostridia bacterium]